MDTNFVPFGHGMDDDDKWYYEAKKLHGDQESIVNNDENQEIQVKPETRSRLISMRQSDPNKLKEFAKVVVQKSGIEALKFIFSKVFGLKTQPKSTDDNS